MERRADVVVIGGGIAGVSVAAEVAADASVILLEREPSLAYHTTGRSAALYFGSYGHPDIVPLSQESLGWFKDPPHTDHPVLSTRGALTLAFETPLPVHLGTTHLTPTEARAMVPALRLDGLVGAVWEPAAADMDVASIHQAFVRQLRSAGGSIETNSAVTSLSHDDRWTIETSTGPYQADTVVNAAGAWGDELAALAGVSPIGLEPLRRTAFMVEAPPASQQWPLVTDVSHSFYFKPDGEQLLCSPADETPSEPCDARPQEVDIALAIERINEVADLEIRSVRSSWAGLRTFAPDRSMVIGPDPDIGSFFWLVGQGGTGIQTAPAAARLAAQLIGGRVDPASQPFDPARFR